MEERFYYCDSCGNLAFMAIASGVAPYCCGKEMTLLKPNTSDGASEKHVPVVECIDRHNIKVRIGSEPHPMTKEHYIRFVCLETTCGGVIRYLDNNQEPEVCFCFKGKPLAVYAFCNIHGLWKADICCEKKECESTCEK